LDKKSKVVGVQPGDVMIANIGNYVNFGQTTASSDPLGPWAEVISCIALV